MKQLFAIVLSFIIATPAWADITIGVSAPLTGPAASVSEISLPGLKQAVADMNAAGGVSINGRGEKLTLDIMDDACDPKQAVAVAGKLAAKQVTAVIGLSCSGATQAAADVYEDEGIPFVAAIASLPSITQKGLKTLFRPAVRDDTEAKAGVDFIAAKFKGKSIAVVHDKSTWGEGTAKLVIQNLKQSGFTAVDDISLNAGESDFSAIVSRLKQGKYEIVYPALLMREGGLLIRQMAEQAFKPVIVGPVLLAMPDFLSIVGKAKDGVYFTRVRLSDEGVKLAHKLSSTDGEANIYNAQTYAAVQIMAQALTKGKQPQAILHSLREDRFQTVFGPLKFDAKGDIQDMQFDIMQYQGGKAVKVQ